MIKFQLGNKSLLSKELLRVKDYIDGTVERKIYFSKSCNDIFERTFYINAKKPVYSHDRCNIETVRAITTHVYLDMLGMCLCLSMEERYFCF